MPDVPLEISCSDTKRLVDEGRAVLIDCREAEEFQTVSIAGARLIPMSEITQRLGDLACPSDQALIVHCHHGMRSAQVAAWLRENGYPQAQSMAGGIDVWALEIEPGMKRY